MNRSVCVSAAELVSALAPDLPSALRAWESGVSGLQPVRPQDGFPDANQLALCGRISDRSCLRGRRYGAASNLAVHVARRAVQNAGWSQTELRECWIFAASSRGNAGELLRANSWRRPLRPLVASNTLHSEIAAAVSIELGIRGPWQMISNGCSSGLDALGLAWRAIASGWTQRALVVASELPLVPEILRDFADAGLLARDNRNDLFSPESSGFYPAEAGVALTLETDTSAKAPLCHVSGYSANSDAFDALASPPEGEGLGALFAEQLPEQLPALVCSHTTGTRSHAISEQAALQAAFGKFLKPVPPVLPLKTLTGHTLGASGLVDVALLAAAINMGHLPALPSRLTAPEGLCILKEPLPIEPKMVVWKAASGMGGHNALVTVQA
jgi:3-oxoacyl-[acyl-carrier-protein] synthase II